MTGSSRLRAFLCNESGAVTVDWTVLAASVVAMGMAATNVIASQLSILTNDIRVELESDVMVNPFDVPTVDGNTCANMYLDPAADPGANTNIDSVGCTVGGPE